MRSVATGVQMKVPSVAAMVRNRRSIVIASGENEGRKVMRIVISAWLNGCVNANCADALSDLSLKKLHDKVSDSSGSSVETEFLTSNMVLSCIRTAPNAMSFTTHTSRSV